MGKLGLFIGGMATGIVAVFTTALISALSEEDEKSSKDKEKNVEEQSSSDNAKTEN